MTERLQRTIARAAEVQGVGFLTGADVRLRFLPASEGQGVTFERTDRADSVIIPALIEYTVPRARRTALEHQGVNIEMVEHVMAALAGLHIDNCHVQLDAPEPPGCDGSSIAFVEALLDAGIVTQTAPRACVHVVGETQVAQPQGGSWVTCAPSSNPGFTIGYQLNYGPESPIPAQSLSLTITPETFVRDLAFARTFVLEEEVAFLRAQGYGSRTTARDLLIFGARGVIDNELRCPDECARHKILDCIGDFALIGCDLSGKFVAHRSGHQLNGDLIRSLRGTQSNQSFQQLRRAA